MIGIKSEGSVYSIKTKADNTQHAVKYLSHIDPSDIESKLEMFLKL